ncbi:MAG TPA: DNA-directed RNA polymerase subunit B'', partial [Methanothrix sp.]|nr:DNA-directed RNA polymerase subunit B'' [Methanothrix sp.]
MLDRSVLYRAYFTKDKLVHHHINSFNEFIDRGLQKVIDEVRIIETNIENTYVKLGKIRVEKPVVMEADGSVERLYPNDARLRNLTYASPIKLEMSIVDRGEEKEPVEAMIGMLPIMVMSKVCNLYGMSEEEMVSYGEDPLDPGGYFIVNGSERVIMTLEDLAPNKILVEYNQRYDEFIEVAKVFSQRQGYRSLVIVERGKRSILEVSFPSVAGRINFVTLVRALGLETDMDIVKAVSDNPEIMKFMLENLEEAEVSTTEEALEKIGNRVAAGQAKEYQKKR